MAKTPCATLSTREPKIGQRYTGSGYTKYTGQHGDSFMLNSARKTSTFAAAMISLAALVGSASADTTWQKNHPRREQVNNRLANQNKRIHNDVKNGTLTKGQAAALHHEDHQVRQEERDMASQNGGHITKSEQRVLNQQENGISKQIPPK